MEDTGLDCGKDGLKPWNANEVSSTLDFPSQRGGKALPSLWDGPGRSWKPRSRRTPFPGARRTMCSKMRQQFPLGSVKPQGLV